MLKHENLNFRLACRFWGDNGAIFLGFFVHTERFQFAWGLEGRASKVEQIFNKFI